MTDSTHTFEIGLVHQVPRRVPFKARMGILAAAGAVLIFLTAALGVASLFESARLLWLEARGHTVQGTVTAIYYGSDRELAYSPDRASQISGFEYAFPIRGGRMATAVAPIQLSRTSTFTPGSSNPVQPEIPAPHYLPGAHLAVRYARAGTGVVSRPWDKPPMRHMTFLAVTGIAMLAIAYLIARRTFGYLADSYRLVRHGTIFTGTICEKIARTEDTARYFVRFSGHPPARAKSEPPLEWTRPCTAQQFLGFDKGQRVTLICPPDRPDETTIYRLLPFW